MRMAFTYFRANHEIARRNRSIRISEKPARKLCETSSVRYAPARYSFTTELTSGRHSPSLSKSLFNV